MVNEFLLIFKATVERLQHERDLAKADVERLVEERDALRERLKVQIFSLIKKIFALFFTLLHFY